VSTTELIVVLQLVVIFLLCEPQARRARTVRVFTMIALGLIILRYAAPAVVGFLLDIFQPIIQKIGWVYFLCSIVGLGYLIALCVAWWRDAKENRAIRSGSQQAFDKRVEEYIRDHKYSRERAIAVTTGIRDGKYNRCQLRKAAVYTKAHGKEVRIATDDGG
jgi:hypothetical protein